MVLTRIEKNCGHSILFFIFSLIAAILYYSNLLPIFEIMDFSSTAFSL